MIIRDAISRARKDMGITTDDTYIGDRYFFSVMKSVRAELLRQEVEKKGLWTGFPMQTLSKFQLERVDLAESIEFNVGIPILKSVFEFPELMDIKTGKINAGIYMPNGVRLDLITFPEWRNSLNRRFVSGQPKAILRNKHLFIVEHSSAVSKLYVDADGLFENPEQVEVLNDKSCNDNKCIHYPDLDFYLPQYLEGRFFRMVKDDIAWGLRIPRDNSNNGKDDIAVSTNQTTNGKDPG